jgi:hypothetical protein
MELSAQPAKDPSVAYLCGARVRREEQSRLEGEKEEHETTRARSQQIEFFDGQSIRLFQGAV